MASPDATFTDPVLPAGASPEVIDTSPLTPLLPPSADAMSTCPLDVAEPAPEVNDTRPPEEDADVAPPTIDVTLPLPVSVLPPLTVTDPAAAPSVLPLPTVTAPVFPFVLAPLANDTLPLSPALPPAALPATNAPLFPEVLPPLVTDTLPPTPAFAFPPDTDALPPLSVVPGPLAAPPTSDTERTTVRNMMSDRAALSAAKNPECSVRRAPLLTRI